MSLKSTKCYLKQQQIIGNEQKFEDIEEQDIITSLDFDPTGNLLAIGDNAGRIIIFKEQEQQEEQQNFQNYTHKRKKTYEYHSEFQSHTLQFDTLKSIRMDQKIKVLKFLPPQGKYHKMITSNSHRIKLFKLYQKYQSKVILTGQRHKSSNKQLNQHNQNLPKTKSIHNILNNKSYKKISEPRPEPASKTSIPSIKQISDELAIPLLQHSTTFTAQPSIIFPIKHQTEINNVQLSNNQQYIFSTDSNKALLWSIQRPEMPFIVESVNDNMNGFTGGCGKSYGVGGVESLSSALAKLSSSTSTNNIVKNNWSENQTISCSKFHTVNDNIFLIGSTKGNIQLNDIRQSFNKRNNLNFGICNNYDSNRQSNNIYSDHNFTQMTKKINSLTFFPLNDKYIISRDYLTVKIWDISLPSHPLKTIHPNRSILSHLSHLFQHQCLQDQFSLSSYSQNNIITGSYDNRFNMINPITQQNVQYQMSFNNNGWKRGIIDSNQMQNQNQYDYKFKHNFDINRKIRKIAVSKQNKKVALASLNGVIVYEQDHTNII